MSSSTFCPLLFQHLATHPYGGVTHCCIADHRFSRSNAQDYSPQKIYNIYSDNITETFNSESFRSARLDSLDNKIPLACKRCFDEEAQGIVSKRLAEIKNFSSFTETSARAITDEHGFIADPQFEFVELRLGNLCNIACRTCNPQSSSKWLSDHSKLKKSLSFDIIDFNHSETYKWAEQKKFWEDLLDHIKTVKRFYINGGEPTLIKQHFVFLKRLIDLGLTDVELWYNINLTNLNDEIIEIWKQFRYVKISCSIDDLFERNDYIRWPSNWPTVFENFKRLLRENFIVDITQTVSFMNYPYLDEFYKFFSQGYGVHIHHNFVYNPDYLSPFILPREFIDKIHNRFETTLPIYLSEHLKSFFNEKEFDHQLWKNSLEYTAKLDAVRNQNFLTTFPEFKGIINV